MRLYALVAAVMATCACAGAIAADIQSIELEQEDERYIARVKLRLAAPAEEAFATMQDYHRLSELNPAVLEVHAEELMPGVTRLHATVRLCAMLYCKDVKLVQDMRSFGLGEMNASVHPDSSDVHYGYAYWQFRDCAGQACLLFKADLEPKFWIPPVLTHWALKRMLRRESLTTAEGIEKAVRNGF